jgi:hypothetical protein
MNSPVRAISELKADGADRASIPLAFGEIGPATIRGSVVALERPAPSDVLDDIVTSRMKDLAARLAACAEFPKTADTDAPLEQHDVEFQPVTLAAITGLRGQVISDIDGDDWQPAPPVAAIAPPSAPMSAPNMSMRSSETISERNLQSLLAVLEPPTPLRLAGEVPTSRLIPVADAENESKIDTFVDAQDGDAMSLPATTPPANNDLVPWTPAVPATGTPLMLADQSADDIRLVDLIQRQKSLLDQLNQYPPAPFHAAESPAQAPAALPPTRSVFDQLAPTQPVIPSEPRRLATPEVPPPLPSPGSLRVLKLSPDDAEHALTERSPMIIERARAERSGLAGTGKSAAAPSPLPAFAAGVAIAFAIAGSLLLVL